MGVHRTGVYKISVAATLCALALPAHAAPQIEIKARTALSLTRVHVAEVGRVDVRGQLLDKLTNLGIGSQAVHIVLGDREATAITRPDGSFSAALPAEPGPVRVTLRFGGDRSLDRAESMEVVTDPAKQHVELAIDKVADVPAGAMLRVAASGDDGPLALPLIVEIAPYRSDKWKPLLGGPGTREARLLARREAGGAGLYRVRARFAGDARTQSASKETTIEVVTATTTTMALTGTRLAFGDRLGVAGTVLDEDLQPVAGAAVTLTTADRRLAHFTTGNDGNYAFSIKGAELGAGTATLQVTADPGRSYAKPSSSAQKRIAVASPHPTPDSYTVLGLIVTSLAAAAFLAARKSARSRLQRRASLPDLDAVGAEAREATAGGIELAKPSLAAALRRATDHCFGGSVYDVVRRRPIGNATVRAANSVDRREATCSETGSFCFESLSPGHWDVSVSAPGHLTERFSIAIPHRGELRSARIDLVPVRERAFQLYRKVAEPALPNRRLWGIWSPRQIVDHVHKEHPTPALAALTAQVEEIYFSPRVAQEDALAEIQAHVDKAEIERAEHFPGSG
jgi:hypothetical protein